MMQELVRTIDKAIDGDPTDILQDAAKKWAAHALSTYTDDFLHAALGISESLSNFAAKLKEARDG